MNVLDRFRLDGKRLFITGGSRGFGRVIALAAAEAGADVALNARDGEALARTAGEVRERGRRAWTFAGDVAQPAVCESLCRQVLAEAGPIDILVNNVGGRNIDVAVEAEELDTWQKLVDLNLTHTFLCTKIIGGAMLARGVTVNAICPGLFMTEPNLAWSKTHPEVIETLVQGIPMGRPGEPDEIGPLAVYLASPASSYVTGAAFVIDGGYTLW